MRSIQVLAPARKGECGVQALNVLLQQALNPPKYDRPSMTYGETIFRVGDKVIQTHNDYQIEWRRLDGEEGTGIFNGDVGYITSVDPEEKTLTVLFDEERSVEYDSESLPNL